MIIYENMWKTMKQKGITQYKLINNYGFSAGQLSRMRANSPISTHTINTICSILNCKVEDIMTYIPDKN